MKEVQSSDKNNTLSNEKYQGRNLGSFAYKVVCIDNKVSKNVVVYKGKSAIYVKNPIISAEDDERFQLSKYPNVIPNGLEKYLTFTINKNVVFIDSMQFINSSLDALVKICQIMILNIYLKKLMMNF